MTNYRDNELILCPTCDTFTSDKIDYAERLFKLKQLEYRIEAAERELRCLYIDGDSGRTCAAEIQNCCTEISELLEDD